MGLNAPKLVIFGIDGGDWGLVERMIARGRLPNLARFIQRGAHAEMECTWPAHTAPGWASLVTAQPPGEHGIYQFFHTQDPEYRARIVRSDDYHCTSMWDWLVGAGMSVGLVNIPMSHPPRGYRGYEISWPLENTLRFSSPPGLLAELAACGCQFQSDLACMYRGDLQYIHSALANVEARGRSVRHLMSRRPTDVVMVVLTEIDRVCHHYWHFSDPSHPSHVPGAQAAYVTAIDDVHEAVDRVLGEITRDLPEQTSIVIVSDHGSGPGHDAFSVHQLLEEHGLLAVRDASDSPAASWFTDGGRQIDFSRTAAYMPVPGSYGVNLNLRGRQSQGVVRPDERERMLDQIRDLCLEVTSPRTGRRIFADVLRRESAYAGRACDFAPDLLLVPADERIMVSGHLSGPPWKPSYQTGHHRHRGMWIHASERLRPGRLPQPVRIVDVAPTALADIGLSLPDPVQGRVVREAFASSAWAARAAGAPCAEERAGGAADAGPRREEEVVIERLRAMGYL
ncbi:uncharacterized protein SOCEGT47_074470 [Sorangium cellulosum]|uniref:Phosphodiesterase n=1 Tax=Sorangium cellulosum TaxID=56 RepID=A0A4P2QB27_SORCE|nr:alkaline phosphatase family protein [Sorangium cellulosum]AUX26877.1 uncharacterized protein SOCEGT47_074470 [Sorangium cellulosum]